MSKSQSKSQRPGPPPKRALKTLKVTRIQVLLRKSHPDLITLDLDAPPSFPKMIPYARIEVQRNGGIEWVRQTFGREPDEIIDIDRGIV